MHIPDYFKELVEETAFSARKSEFVDQKSGVSARMSINLIENIVSNMEYRAILTGEKELYPRLCDLHAALTALTGKIELVYEGEQEGLILVARKIIGTAVKKTFRTYFPSPNPKSKPGKQGHTPPENPYQPILDWFAQENTLSINDSMNTSEFFKSLDQVDGLRQLTLKYLEAATDGELALGMEFILEGLHQHNMVSKRDMESSTSYQDMLKAMLQQGSEDFKEKE